MDDELGYSSANSGPPAASFSTDYEGRDALARPGTQGRGPVGIPVTSRPGRYNDGIETTPLTPPSSSHNLELLFDSSKIYETHPRKYRLLLEKEQGGSADQGLCGTSRFQFGVQTGDRDPARSSTASVAVKDGRIIAMGGATSSSSGSSGSSMPGFETADSKRPEVHVSPASAMLPSEPGTHGGPDTVGLPPGAASDIHGVGVRSGISSLTQGSRDQVSTTAAKSRFIPQEFLQSFSVSVRKPGTTSTIPGGSSAQGTTPLPDPSPQPSSEARLQALSQGSSIPAGSPEKHGGKIQEGCQSLQPAPRRLFGIGPLYWPLPETVCGGAAAPGDQPGMGRCSSSPNLLGLSNTVRQEGLTGSGYSVGTRRRGSVDLPDSGSTGSSAAGGAAAVLAANKKGLSPSEVNTWLTGPF